MFERLFEVERSRFARLVSSDMAELCTHAISGKFPQNEFHSHFLDSQISGFSGFSTVRSHPVCVCISPKLPVLRTPSRS